jgi:hypothetical protein
VSHVPAALRRAVHERALGACEYCLVPEALTFAVHEVDHVIAQKHGGTTEESNLALSCALCNKHRGSDLASIDPETGHLTSLYHPRRERWSAHFRIEEAKLIPLTSTARVTVRLLQMNHPDRIAERTLLIAAGLIRPPA